MPPRGCPMPEAAKRKIRQARLGKPHSPATRQKIRNARAKQPPPNLRHGRYSRPNREQDLEITSGLRLTEILGLTPHVVDEFCGQYSNQTTLSINLISYLETLYKFLDDERPVWLECPSLKRYHEEGAHPLEWLRQAKTDFGLNLDFTLTEIRHAQETIVRDHKEALAGKDEFAKRKYNRCVRRLERLFADAARKQNGDRPIKLFNEWRPIHKQKNFLHLLKLKVVMDRLCLWKTIDKRQYIKGIFWQKKLPKAVQRNFTPLQTLSSPLCILDFLAYLKENWYERHAFSPGTNKEDIRTLEYGYDYYEERATVAVGYVSSMVARAKRMDQSRFRAEIFQLSEIEEFAWYLAITPVLKPWRKLIRLARKEVYDLIKSIEHTAEEDERLAAVLQRLREDSDERWRRAQVPMYNKRDRDALSFVFGHDPQLYRQATTLLEELCSQQPNA